MTCATAVSFTQGFGPLALAPMFPQLIEAFHSNLTDVVQFTGVCILVLGFSNFIWYAFVYRLLRHLGLRESHVLIWAYARVPISTSFGRRPVYIASVLICLVSNIWRAKAQTYSSFMGACVLNGIGAGPGEVGTMISFSNFESESLTGYKTIQPTVIADVMFLHDRGKYNTLYFAFYFGSLVVRAPSLDKCCRSS